MRRLLTVMGIVVGIGVPAVAAVGRNASEKPSGNFVLVRGGTFRNTKSNYYGKGVTISDFYIARYLVTQKEWTEVMGSNPSKFKGDSRPVEMVTWYDSIEYCNQMSFREGLKPYYNIDKSERDPNNQVDPRYGDLDNIKWAVTINSRANGYRLPTEAEWEYAASGGRMSRSYAFSGSDDISEVAWYWKNSGDRELTGFWNWPALEQNHNQTQPVGSKKPNELGLYDMSGDVREWCWDWYGDLEADVTDPGGSRSGFKRVWKGGGWMGAAFCAESAYRGSLAANGRGPDQGFRICRGR